MRAPSVAGILLWMVPLGGSASADVVTLKNGEELECLVVSVTDREVKLLRGAEGVSETRHLPLSDVAAIRLAPPEVGGFRSAARRLEADRALEEAGELLRQVCILRPESVADHLRLARLWRQARRLDAAAEAARAAARTAPDDPRVLLEQGEIALAQGNGPQAVIHAREHLRHAGTDSADGQWLLGRALEASGQREEALDSYTNLVRSDPRRSEALDRLSSIALETGKPDLALKAAFAVTRTAPTVREGWISLGRAYYRQHKFEEAVGAFRSATALGGEGYDRARIFFQCALARRYGRDPRQVLSPEDLERAFELDPELRKEHS
jgi:tetratricopeptide (TPR) repeat protein